MRLPFLILTPVCVFLGASVVVATHGTINLSLLLLALLGALFAHVSVNVLNEYYDFKSGLDLTTQRTPFSGGSGALPGNPEVAGIVLAVGVTSLLATSAIGGFFIWTSGPGILPIGMMGLLLIVSYTRWVNRRPLLCLIAPGLGIGFLMVVGTQFVLQGEHVSLAWIVSAVPFFLVNNLLLVNQYPDIQADTRVGRKNFPIVYGLKVSNGMYALFAVAATVTVVWGVGSGQLPRGSLIALAPMPLAVFSLYGAIKHRDKIACFPQYLGANVLVALLTPLLLGISLVTGSGLPLPGY